MSVRVRNFVAVIVFVLVTAGGVLGGAPKIYAQVSIPESSLQEFHPRLFGAGGTYSGVAGGLPAVFTNPAFLADIPLTVNYFSSTSWVHTGINDLFPGLTQLAENSFPGIDELGKPSEDPARKAELPMAPGIPNLLLNEGVGLGSSIIGGAYGNNFAAVASFTSDFFFYGNAEPTTTLFGSITHDVRLSLSAATPPIRGDSVRFSVGFTIEPFYRTSTFFRNGQAEYFLLTLSDRPVPDGLINYNTANNTLYGTGVSFHAGALLTIFDQVSAQITVRDIGDTRIFYSRTSLQNLLDGLGVLSLPDPARIGDTGYASESTWVLPVKGRFGISYHPRWDVGILIEPRLSLEISERVFSLPSEADAATVMEAFHMGAEVTLDEFFTFQIGLSQGQLTLGTGFDFGLFEVHSAWFGVVRALNSKRVTSHGLIISFQFNGDPAE